MSIFIGFLAGAVLAFLMFSRKTVRIEAELEAERTNLAKMQEQMSDHFEALSAKVAKDSQHSFLVLAEQSFRRLQDNAKAEQEKGAAAIKGLVEPVQKNLETLHSFVQAAEKERHGAFSELNQSLSLIHQAASTLAQSLRSPTTRGKWGEIHLRRALEAVGMTERVDFIEQDMLQGDNGFQKPDVVIRLPGSRSIVIDAKAPLDAFLDAARAGISDEERQRALTRHADQVRKHIRTLSSRAYWEKLDSPEFVLMYLPGDAYYAAALEADSSLFEAGIESKVFLMTPTTLIPALRVIEHAWKQEKLAQNAREISTLGQELHKRLTTFGAHLEKMRKGLSSAVGSFDEAVGSLERSVMPVARKFRNLQGGEALSLPDAIGQSPRGLTAPEFLNDDGTARKQGSEDAAA